jgi:Flp pilus assembly protein TadG
MTASQWEAIMSETPGRSGKALRMAARFGGRLRRCISTFAGDTRGNVAIMFCLALLPMIGGVAVAIDYSRASAKRTDLQAAADSAALAGAQKLGESDKEVTAAVQAFLEANLPPEYRSLPFKVEITDGRKRVAVTLTRKVDASFTQVFGVDKIDIAVVSEATFGIENSEVVMALDTTGTMKNHMPALREGAKEFLTILYRNTQARNQLKVGLVPYVTAVNLGNHARRMDWMDTNADARFHGENFEGVAIKDKRCDPPPPPQKKEDKDEKQAKKEPDSGSKPPPPASSPPPSPPPIKLPPISPDLGSLELEGPVRTAALTNSLLEYLSTTADSIVAALAITGAHAAGSWPYGTLSESTPVDCNRKTPSRVNHFDLFDAMNVAWKGCVEARPAPYDVTDEAPNRGKPDTLFVPYLWPDEHDEEFKNGNVRNSYLPDKANMPSWVKNGDDPVLRQAWIWKYDGGTPTVDNAAFITRGPNAACPDPIVPLTSNKATLDGAIDSLRAYGASGTNIGEGLAWAWRVISPGDPFPEGALYDKKNKKFIVLMTDGFNEIVPQGVAWNGSDYTSTGYAAKARFGTSDRAAITRELDRRLAEVCSNIKAKEIQVFTLLFDPVGYTQSSDVENLLRNCATTKDRHVFKASSHGQLVKAFQTIANEIVNLRLTR